MITYRCSECGEVAKQGIDEQGNEGALHCLSHPNAVIDSVSFEPRNEPERKVRASLDAPHKLGVVLAPQYWYTCPLCGQRIVDGKPCGCGAR